MNARSRIYSLASKSLATDWARKRLFLCVDLHMPFQVFHAREDPLTERTLDISAIIWCREQVVHRGGKVMNLWRRAPVVPLNASCEKMGHLALLIRLLFKLHRLVLVKRGI